MSQKNEVFFCFLFFLFSFFFFLFSFFFFLFSYCAKLKCKGYERARKEVRGVARLAVKSTMNYLEKDSQNALVSNEYTPSRIKILLLPRWKLTILGDEYVIRRPLRAAWTTAWFMTCEDSEEMDRKIQSMHKNSKYAIQNIDPTRLALHTAMETVIDNVTQTLIDGKRH